MGPTIYSGNLVIAKYGEIDLMPGRDAEEFISMSPIGEDPIQSDADLDGNVTFYCTKDGRQSLVLTLKQTSPVNTVLAAVLAAVKLTGDLLPAIKPLTVKDPNNIDSIFDANCVVSKWPEIKYGTKPGKRLWGFILAEPDIALGGIPIGG